MANRIKRSDIAEEDLFKSIRESAKKTIKTLTDMEKSLKKTAATIKKDLKGSGMGNSSEINKMTQAIQKANKAKQESVKIAKSKQQAQQNLKTSEAELLRIERERIKNEREQIRTGILLKKEKERELKIKNRLAKANKRENTEYGKLVKNTRNLKNQSKELAAQLLRLEQNGKRNTKEFLKLSQSYKQTTNAARQGDAALKKIDSTVGDNFRNVGNYSGALNTLKSGLMQLGLAVGGFQVLRGAFSTVVDFDQATADLAAISGKTKKELEGLNDQAKELGATTQFTATQITQMQIELAKLGFTQEQISASTEGVSNFAAATGADIPEAAVLAGSALRGFGLDAVEMDRVVSVLGVATTKSALDFTKLSTSLSKVAPVANAMGFSIEDTTALLAQLANAGFDASMMGTATRNIFLKLADANGDLAKKLGGPVTTAEELADGLKKLQEQGIDLTEALELTDKRSVAAFETFLKGSGDLVDLRDSITDVDKELKDMAEKRLDSINGQMTLLNSAWEGWLLNLNETSGAGAGAKSFIGFLATNLNTIMNLLFKTARALVVYKLGLFAVATAQKAWNLGLKGSIKALFTTTTATKGAAAATTGLGRAMKSVPWLLIIGLVAELAMHFYDVATGADKAANAQRRLKIAQENAQKIGELKNKELKEEIKLEKQKIDLQLSEGKITQVQALKLEKKLIKEKRAELKKLSNDQRNQQNESHKRFQDNKKQIESLKKERGRLSGRVGTGDEIRRYEIDQEMKKLESMNLGFLQINKQSKQTKIEFDNINKSLRDSEIELQIAINNEGKVHKSTNKSRASSVKSIKRINTEIKTQINLYSELNKLVEKQAKIMLTLRQIESNRQAEMIREDFENEFDIQVENAKKTGQFSIDNLIELNAKKRDLQIDQINDNVNTEIIAEQSKHDQKFTNLKAALEKERKELVSQKGIEQKDIDKINDNYDIKIKELNALELQSAEVLEDQIVLIKKKGSEEVLNVTIESAKEIEEVEKELVDNISSYQEKSDQDLVEKEKDRAKDRRAIAKSLTDYLVRQSQERIRGIEREITAAEKQADHLRALAENGNIEAKSSLAEQNRLIAEANIKKEQELKKQQRIKLAESVYSTYNNKLAEGAKNPLAETIRDTAMLQAFINTLPTFAEGTEDTGTNGKGIDGKGGFLSILHPNERVLTKDQNSLIGNISNEELSRIVNEYNTGKLIGEGASQMGNGWESALIVKHLINVQNAIENRPETNIELEKIVDGALTIAKSTKKGNNITYNRYKIK